MHEGVGWCEGGGYVTSMCSLCGVFWEGLKWCG